MIHFLPKPLIRKPVNRISRRRSGWPTSHWPRGMLGATRVVALSLVIAAGLLALSVLTPSACAATQPGSFPPKAGQPGSTAIPHDDPGIVAWASAVVDYQPGFAVEAAWQDMSRALGPAGEDSHDILCLGRGGSVTLAFPAPIRDGAGFDFVIFENAFSDTFLELAYVEVSSDGETFFRFPNTSLTAEPVPGYGLVDTRGIDGLAGKYRLGFGTPFDLQALRDDPEARHLLDFEAVSHIRIIDIPGDPDAPVHDSSGHPIYDPFPTIGSAGFDLDAAGVINVATSGSGSGSTPDPDTDDTDPAASDLLHTLTQVFANVQPLAVSGGEGADGWYIADWFGAFYAGSFPLIWHDELGWLNINGVEAENLWLWWDRAIPQPQGDDIATTAAGSDAPGNATSARAAAGWLWTSASVYPFLWSAESGSWLYYYQGTRGWFYDYGRARAIWIE